MKTKKTTLPSFLSGSLKSLMMLSFCAGLSCCSQDDVKPVPPVPVDNNAATVGGNIYHTPNGYLFDLGKSSKYNSRNFVVDFSNGIYDGTHYSPGTTTIITIDFNSSSQSSLAEGTYTLNHETDSNGLPDQKPMTFSDAYAHVDLKYQNGNLTGGTRYDVLTTGSVTVQKTNSGYIISYTLTYEGGITLEGLFNGTLTYFEV